jgi:hypothetical protein
MLQCYIASLLFNMKRIFLARFYVLHIRALRRLLFIRETNKCILVKLFNYILFLIPLSLFDHFWWPSSECCISRIQIIYQWLHGRKRERNCLKLSLNQSFGHLFTFVSYSLLELLYYRTFTLTKEEFKIQYYRLWYSSCWNVVFVILCYCVCNFMCCVLFWVCVCVILCFCVL